MAHARWPKPGISRELHALMVRIVQIRIAIIMLMRSASPAHQAAAASPPIFP
jgi:hypothetical protein